MSKSHVPSHAIDAKILSFRGQRVILDADLAAIYGVATKRLNEQVRRNRDRFPTDFCFQLTNEEWKLARALRSQNATLEEGRGRHRKYRPLVFTEHGAIMAANILNSRRAIQMSVFVVRAFLRMRGILTGNRELAQRLTQLEKELKKRLDVHETAIIGILQRIMDLIDPPPSSEPRRKRIGF